MKVAKCPSDVHSMSNRAIVNGSDFPPSTCPHVSVSTGPGLHFVFTIEADPKVAPGTVGFALPQRKWATLSLNQEIHVTPFEFKPAQHYLTKVVLEVDYFNKKNASATEPYNSDDMAKEFSMQFPNQAFTVGQQAVFNFQDKKLLQVVVKDCEATNLHKLQAGEAVKPHKTNLGILLPNSTIIFEKMEGSSLNLTGKSKGKLEHQSIINPEWDFTDMGIGGLDEEFNAIFRRAFASRVFPPEIMEQLGAKHVKGILLYGPPGNGKTLMARQIGTMLNAREPKIVNGPQILDKYVGESEANIRRLFEDAEEEEKRLGPNSGLHIIIFDEIDAICKARGSVAGNSGVHDTVVNQLLSKIDGVDQLNNILVIGMTNRKDMIDEALLRPGRLEVQIEIGLPKEAGRVQILNIHTKKMIKNKKLADDVDIPKLAAVTKNFSGAELEGLVRAAQSCALNRLVKANSKVEVDPEAAEKLMVGRTDFEHALEHDIKPAYGTATELLETFLAQGVIEWGEAIKGVLEDGELLIQQAKSGGGSGLVSILLEGAPNAGKTALAAQLAKTSGFPFVKICSPEDMVGFTESAKCTQIRKVFDEAYRSTMSCIVVDNIERLIDYGPIGPRYSNLTLQALLVLLKKQPPKGRQLLVIATTSRKEVLDQMEMMSAFTDVLHVPNLSRDVEVMKVVMDSGVMDSKEMGRLEGELAGRRASIGVKKLLGLLDMVRQTKEGERSNKLISKLEEEGFVSLKM